MRIDWLPSIIRRFSKSHAWFAHSWCLPRPHIRQRYQIGMPTIEALEDRAVPALIGLPIDLPLPLPPVTLPDTYSVQQNTPFTANNGVLANDTDVNNDPLTAILASGPSNGTLLLNSNGTFSYTPNPGFTGIDTFTYNANDGHSNSLLPGLVTLIVNVLPNQPPVANNDVFGLNEDAILDLSLGTVLDGVLANDTDPDILGLPIGNLVLVATIVTPPQHGTLIFLPTGTFIYTPDANFHGVDTFTYQASDLLSLSNVATVTFNVGSVNDAPISVGDSYSTNEDTVITIPAAGVLANDTDSDGDPLTAAIVGNPSHGTVTLNPNGSFVYTPAANFNGTDSFTYQASDGTTTGAVTTVTIVVNPVSDPVIAVNDSYSINEDNPLSVLVASGVLSNDSNPDGGLLTAAIVTNPQHGTLVLLPNGSFVYTPALNFSGTDTFRYQASNGATLSNLATVSITVNGVNDPPVANNDSFTANEDQPLIVNATGVLSNDSDVEGSPLTAILVTQPAHGTVTLNSNGSFTYTPNANYNGADSFTYKANDGMADSNVATVSITVNSVNDAPVSVNDSYSVTEDTPLAVAASGVLSNDSDPDNDPLTASLVTAPLHGTLTLLPNGGFLYVPAANYNGPDSFTYRASDGTTFGNTATVTLTVTAVNDAPVAAPNLYSTTAGTLLTVNTVNGVLSNDFDVDGNPLTAVLVTGPVNGTLTLNADGSLTYNPNLGFLGSDSFTYRASDATALSALTTVTIAVNAGANAAPVAVNDTFIVQEDVPLDLTSGTAANGVLGNDTDADNTLAELTATIVTPPQHGTVALQPNGTFLYTPDANFFGTDSFTYLASDSSSFSNIATVTLTVTGSNDAPVATADSYTVTEDTVLTITAPGILTNDTDADQDILTAVLVMGPTHGTLTLNPNGSFTYTPAANYSGADSFTYQANDGTALSGLTTVSFSVLNVNDAPVGIADTYTVNEDTPLNLLAVSGVLSNDTDADGNPLSAILVGQPLHGTITLSSNGAFLYTPDANFSGTDTFSYQATDGQALSGLTTVTINVSPVNDAPTAVSDNYSVASGTLTVNVGQGLLSNDVDVDGDSLTAALSVGPTNGSLTLNPDGSFTYTPTVGFSGIDTFSYRASDGQLQSAVTTVTISVVSVANRAPVANNDSYSVTEDQVFAALANGVLSNDTDADGNTLTVTLVSGPAHGTVVLNSNGTFTYTPQANYSGADSFTYQASDGTLNSGIATVSLTIAAVNDAPVATADSYNVIQNQALVVVSPGVLQNDTDVDSNTLTAILVTQPTHGTLILNSNGSFTYTPNNNYFGIDSFTYRVSDGTANSSATTVNLSVSGSNQVPVSVNDTYSVVEDNTLTVLAGLGVLSNDTDGDGDTLTVSVVNQPLHGSLTLGANGSFVYTPNANFSGTDTFSYAANDGTATGTAALVTITVTGVNDAPVGVTDNYSVLQNQTLNIASPGVLQNDTDPDGDALTATVLSQPSHGALTFNANGSFTYSPTTNYTGSDSFTYRVNDGTTNSGVTTVNLTVNASNQAPVAVNDTYTVVEDSALTVAGPGVLVNDTDADGDTLFATVITPPAHGTVSLAPSGGFIYIPNANFSGTDTFTYATSDGIVSSGAATVTITVTGVNDAPVGNNDNYSVTKNAVLTVTAPGVLSNDTDVEGNSLTAVLATGPTHGTLTLNANGSFVYTPTANYTGTDTFTYRASDGTATGNLTTVTLTVNGANDAPTVITSAGARTVKGRKKLIVDTAVNIIDADSPTFNGGKMDIVIQSGAGTTDSLTFGRGGARRGFVNIKRNVLRVGLVQVGTVTGGLRGVPIHITFNSNATLARVKAVAQSVIFRGTNKQVGPRVISIQVTDDTNLTSNLATKIVNVT